MHVRSLLEKIIHNIGVAASNSKMQGRPAEAIDRIDFRFVVNEDLQTVEVVYENF